MLPAEWRFGTWTKPWATVALIDRHFRPFDCRR
jgi:hypothetical protein